jgi:hypothetical protein
MYRLYHLREWLLQLELLLMVYVCLFFSSEPIKEVVCKLCQVTLQSTQALRLHLQTAQHIDHEDELAK